jgi:3-hydroxybutyryl-CoA dehydrogenase
MKLEEIKTIAVIGTGIMGHGISHVCAQAGYKVNIATRSPETLGLALSSIKSELETLVGKGILTKEHAEAAFSRIEGTLDRSEAVKNADFVIEAVKEDIDLKKRIFKEFDEQCPKHTILATNTSSFSIAEVASATKRQDKVVGMHWWNPPYAMPLIEVIKGAKTSKDTIELTKRLTTKLGKVPVICKDSPGFIGVRLQAALFTEAMSILEQGLASAEDIDTTVKMSLGIRLPVIGPLETLDMGGLDTFLYAYDYLHEKLGEKFQPPKNLRQNVKEGRLGLKTKKGFYEYTPESAAALTKRRDEWILKQLKERTEKLTGKV